MPRDVMYLFVYAHTRNNATQLRHMSMWTRPRDVRNKERSLEVANFLKGRHHQCDGPVPLRRAAAYSYVFLLAYCSLV